MGSNIPCAAPPHIVSTVFFESRLEHGTGLEVGHAVAVHGFYGALPGHAVEHPVEHRQNSKETWRAQRTVEPPDLIELVKQAHTGRVQVRVQPQNLPGLHDIVGPVVTGK